MFKKKLFTLALAMVLLFSQSVFYAFAAEASEIVSDDATQEAKLSEDTQIKNIIFLIPDGGGDTLMDLADMVKQAGGIDKTKYPNSTVTDKSPLSLLSYLAGFCTTRCANYGGTDSAAAGTALATGYKTNSSYIGVNPNAEPLANLVEAAKSKGKATGIVATVEWMHATPAAFTAHSTSRNDYKNLYEQIENKELDVVLGAGYGKVTSYGASIQNAMDAGYKIIKTKSDAASVKAGDKLWGNVSDSSLPKDTELTSTQPTLAQLTDAAITALSGDEDGFFLMVEGSKVDNGGHNNDAFYAAGEYLAFDAAWKVAVDFAKGRTDTVVIGAPDHDTGGLNLKDDMTSEIAQIQAGKNPDTLSWESGDHTRRNVPVWIYVPEGVEILEGLNPVPGDSESSRNDYVIDNTAFAPYLAEFMGVDLDELTDELFVDVTSIGNYMPTSGRFVFNNNSNGEKYIYENADTYYVGDTATDMHGKVAIYVNDKFYVPAEMVDEEDWEYLNPENPDIIEGSGTAENPYLIDSAKDFLEFATGIMNDNDYADTYYKQICDINLANNPDFLGLTDDYTFAGVYDGNGKTINVGYTSASAASPFPAISGSVINLGVAGSIASTSADMTGGIASKVLDGGKIINCYSIVNFDGASFGGVTAENNGSVVNSYFAGNVDNASVVYPIANSKTADGIINCYYVYNEDYYNFTDGATYLTEAEAVTTLAYYLEGGIEDAEDEYGFNLTSWERSEEDYPVFKEDMPFVTGVRLYPSTQTVAKGGKFQFSAMVDGIGDYSWETHWVLEPESSFEGTYINERGVLFVDKNETRESFTVQAKSKANGAVAASARVTIGENEEYTFPKGSGTKEDPYLITSEKDFFDLTAAVNGGTDYLDKYFKQTVDIDMAGFKDYTGMAENKHFKGKYDGAGHIINVNIVNTSGSSGVFPRIDRGYIINLGTTGTVNTAGRAGGIALYGHNCGKDNNARIVNCWSTVNVVGTGNTGGLIADLIGDYVAVLSNCYFAGTVSGPEGKTGILATNGANNKRVSNSYFVNDNYSSDIGYTKLSTDEEIGSAHLMLNATREDAATRAGIDADDLALWVASSEGMPMQIVPVESDGTEVTEFEILPDEVSIHKGASRQLSISSEKLANSDVEWSITTSGVMSGTAVNANGYVTIASDEEKSEITVKASLKGNSDCYATATINIIDVPSAIKESTTVANYRNNGYEIVYVSASGSGSGTGESAVNTYNGLTNALGNKTAAGKKTAFVLMDTFTWTSWGNHGIKGGDVVITSFGGKNGKAQYYISTGSPTLSASDVDANVIFDDITIVNNSTTGEPAIHALGNNLTLTENVIVDTQNGKTLTLRANADSMSTITGNKITVETPSLVNLHACGTSTKISTINGDVEFVVGKNANIGSLYAAGKGKNTNVTTGNVYVYLKDNAKVNELAITSAGATIDGNLYVNISDSASVGNGGITFKTGTVTGNAIITMNGGAVSKVESDATKVLGKTIIIVDENNADIPESTVNVPYVVAFSGNGKASCDTATNKLTLTPGNGVKYVRVTNGENVTSYDVINGGTVELASEGDIVIDLAQGTTKVEFLNDGTVDSEDEVTVTYVDETGNGSSAEQTVKIGEITLNTAPTASGYTFIGWSDGENVYEAGATYTVSANTVFTAVWESILFSGGSGTKNDPYIINNESDFKKLTDDVNAGETYKGIYFKQTSDIDMAGFEGYNGMQESKYFRGYYDGAGHTINVNIVNTSGSSGIFPRISDLGYIINLGTTGTVSTAGKSAGIALYIHSNAKGASIVNCWSSVDVISSSGNTVGGITGQINTSATKAVIANCYFCGTITSAGTSGIMCGNETSSTIANTIKPFKNNYFVGNNSYTAVSGSYERLSSEKIADAYKTLNENILTKDYGIESELLMTWSSTTSDGATFGEVKVEETYTVTYVTDKGTAPDGESGLKVGVTYTVADALTADGYTFMGWSDGVITYEAGSSITITADVTFTAVWVKNGPQEVKDTIKVTFAREEGTSPMSFAKVYIYSDNTKDELITAIALENETTDTSEVTAEVTLLEGTYYAEVVKNGYLTFITEITVTDTFSMDEIKLIPGDIKGSFADECGDGVIDIDDFVRVLRGFGTGATSDVKKAVDINEDGAVNVSDIGFVKANFGKTSDAE